MPGFNSRKSFVAVGALCGLAWTAAAPSFAAEPGGPVPDFSSNGVAWVLTNGDYVAVPGGPSPTRNDPGPSLCPQ